MKLILSVLSLVLLSCAHSVHEVHTSDFSPYARIEDGDMVKGSGEQFVILGFTDNTNYVDQAYQQLRKACPQGRITGITTQISTSLGILS